MNPDDLTKILDELGQRLGPYGEAAFQSAVKYQAASAAVGVLAAIVFLSIGFIGLTLSIINSLRAPNQEKREDWYVAGVFSMVVSTLIGFFLLAIALPSFISPEYAALRDILYAIGK